MSAELYTLNGPLLLLAGPGTGKTYSLAQRIKYLVEDAGVSPNELTVITFTAAAADNMKMRISDPSEPHLFVPSHLQPTNIRTMHSLGHSIVREKASELGLPLPITVVRTDATKRVLMADAAQLAGFTRSDAKAAFKCRQFGYCHPEDIPKCQICQKYKEILRACGAIDHDDQILLACEILTNDPQLLSKYHRAASHLLIDEYQDINAAQFKLIRFLSEGQREGLFVVGDDDQSIYSWRGGSPEFIRNFKKHFGQDAKVKPLLCSFRCHRNILEGSLALVRRYDKERFNKGDFEYKAPEGPKILIHNVPSDKREATIVRRIIERTLPARKEVLVLVPHRGYTSLIIAELRRAKIDYIAPEPLPGEGLPVIDRLAAWLNDENDSLALRDCLEAMLNSKILGIPSHKVKRPDRIQERESFYAFVSGLWEAVIRESHSLWQSLKLACGDYEFLGTIYENLVDLRSVDPNEVPRFLELAASCLEPWKKTDSLLEEVAAWVSRVKVTSGLASTAPVQIMTLEGAKGLQADVVCVIGLEQGIIPRESNQERDLAEYSRLMYVSMTRAKSELHLLHSRTRSAAVSFHPVHAKGGSHKLEPSFFLGAIPNAFAERKYYQPQS